MHYINQKQTYATHNTIQYNTLQHIHTYIHTYIQTGAQTKARALFAGLVALAKHTTTPVKVIAQLASVWEAWQSHHRNQPFPDLVEDLTTSDRQRVTVLYVSRNTRTPEAPQSEPQLRRRQRDAALVAWERANSLHNRQQTDWQKTVDQDNTLIYKHAIQRLAKVYEDKEHHIHDKAPRHQGKQTKQRKKDLVSQCRQPWQPQHHRWEPHRSGYHCSACGTRMHQGLTASMLEERLHEQCPQLQLDEHRQAIPPSGPELTKNQLTHQLLQAQQDNPPAPDKHILEETKGYPKCQRCGVNVHKRTNKQAFQEFVHGPCLDQPFQEPHDGRPSHQLWQKGHQVRCTLCGPQLDLDSDPPQRAPNDLSRSSEPSESAEEEQRSHDDIIFDSFSF